MHHLPRPDQNGGKRSCVVRVEEATGQSGQPAYPPPTTQHVTGLLYQTKVPVWQPEGVSVHKSISRLGFQV